MKSGTLGSGDYVNGRSRLYLKSESLQCIHCTAKLYIETQSLNGPSTVADTLFT